MRIAATFCVTTLSILFSACSSFYSDEQWKGSIDSQSNKLGHNNWVIIAEASFPAYNRPGIRQVNANAEVPEVVDYVINSLERTQHVRPKIYLTRELGAVENDFAPGIDELREKITESFHGHEPTVLENESILTLLESARKNFDILVIRTTSALPYSSVFIELKHGYWDAESEARLRQRLKSEKVE